MILIPFSKLWIPSFETGFPALRLDFLVFWISKTILKRTAPKFCADSTNLLEMSSILDLFRARKVFCWKITYIFILSQDLPSIEQLENFDPDLVTRIYSSDGEIIHELFVEKRVFVELDAIPKHMHDAILSSEDRRFRDHWGISLRSVARAIITNVLALS